MMCSFLPLSLSDGTTILTSLKISCRHHNKMRQLDRSNRSTKRKIYLSFYKIFTQFNDFKRSMIQSRFDLQGRESNDLL